jgi:hypothetical protein
LLADQAANLAGESENGMPILKLTGPRPEMVPDSVQLLPNSICQALEDAAAKNPDAYFRVTGELLLYENSVYLLARHAVMIQPQAPVNRDQAPQVDPDKQADDQAAEDIHVGPEQIINKLFDEGKITPLQGAGQAQQSQVGPDQGRGELVINRAVRIKPVDDFWYQARFVSDNTLREEPLILLPGGLLSQARRLSTPPLHVQKLLISGELTRYRGKSYLLLRKVLPQRDLGT